MLNTQRTLRQFVFLVYQLARIGELPPTPWADNEITVDKYGMLRRQGWKEAEKGQMQMCLRFDLPDGSVAHLGNGDLRGNGSDVWFGLIEGPIAAALGHRWIEFGPMADVEIDTAGLLDSRTEHQPFDLRPRG